MCHERRVSFQPGLGAINRPKELVRSAFRGAFVLKLEARARRMGSAGLVRFRGETAVAKRWHCAALGERKAGKTRVCLEVSHLQAKAARAKRRVGFLTDWACQRCTFCVIPQRKKESAIANPCSSENATKRKTRKFPLEVVAKAKQLRGLVHKRTPHMLWVPPFCSQLPPALSLYGGSACPELRLEMGHCDPFL